ncbi:MAG: NADH-quinone oxidoreductase subunit L [Gaiellaceae bacterium]
MIGAAGWVCLLSPLVSALAITLAGNRLRRRHSGYVATAATAVSFAAAVVALVGALGESPGKRSHVTTAFTWLATSGFRVDLSLLVDSLAIVMMLIVAGVGTLIVGYSIDYMDGEDEERRFFAYMSIFVFSMLLLVESGNLLLLLAGWGLVGLSSYLLIGFYQDRPSAVAAAKKAFVMNAIGDATVAGALFLLIQHGGRLDYASVFAGAPGLSHNTWVINLVAAGLLGGALAKSAQIPLHTWLPDAMEGPTPVSALIHAATMVTAGVYLIVRTHPLFEAAPHVQQVAGGLGATTLIVAGLIALVQTDVKRVIAYSTMSQIGYMFLGAGIGAYGAAIFHLMTHAFFKALLFLAAGVVIHALGGEQDMRRMGGLKHLLPRTYVAMLIGAAALAGLPPLAGFFSKDAILGAAESGGTYDRILLAAGIAGVFLTGLYSFRMVFLIFEGEPSPFVREHFHVHGGREGPRWMTTVVTALAALSVLGGWLQVPGAWRGMSNFVETSAPPLLEPTTREEWLTSVGALVLALAGVALAWVVYRAHRRPAPAAPRALVAKLYFDEAYDLFFYRPAAWIAKMLGRLIEVPVIIGSGEDLGLVARTGGRVASLLQTGLLRTYALTLASALSILTILFLVLR